MRRSAAVGAALLLAVAAGAARGGSAFSPESIGVVDAQTSWILGATCVGRGCLVVERTSDGGRTFTRRAVPIPATEGSWPEIYAATERDAYIVTPSLQRRAYATHDGGATWRRLRLGSVIAFVATRRTAYALTARCSSSGCTRYALSRSRVTRDAWTNVATPFDSYSSIVDVAARGSRIWLLGAATARRSHDAIALSLDGGRTFHVHSGPCFPELGGRVVPAPARLVWALCPGGMLSTLFRSADGGASFGAVDVPLTNGAIMAAASSGVALVAPRGAPHRLFRTTDGGKRWSWVALPRGVDDVADLALANGHLGLAVFLSRSGTSLWRTADGGAHWRRVTPG